MKNAILIIFNILILAAFGCAQKDEIEPPVKVARIERDGLQITGAEDALYSPSGKWLAINAESRFYLLPTAKLDEAVADLERTPSFEGQVVGFTPSGKILYTTIKGIYTLDPANLQSQTVFREPLDNERYLSQNAMVVVSENLIVSGDGQFDTGLEKGNILRFDLRKPGEPTSGLQIDGFEYPMLSPSGRFILYEHGGENSNHADLYDVRQNVNYSISKRFDFKAAFPKYKKTSEVPIAWVGANRFLMIVEENKLVENDLFDPSDVDGEEWLALGDASTGKIVWKRQSKISFLPSQFQQMSPTEAVAQFEGRLYDISLLNGETSQTRGLYGSGFALSPDRKKFAFLRDEFVLTSSIDGTGEKIARFLPPDWQPDAGYKGMGERAPLWSPDGKRLIVFGKKRMLFIKAEPVALTEPVICTG